MSVTSTGLASDRQQKQVLRAARGSIIFAFEANATVQMPLYCLVTKHTHTYTQAEWKQSIRPTTNQKSAIIWCFKRWAKKYRSLAVQCTHRDCTPGLQYRRRQCWHYLTCWVAVEEHWHQHHYPIHFFSGTSLPHLLFFLYFCLFSSSVLVKPRQLSKVIPGKQKLQNCSTLRQVRNASEC